MNPLIPITSEILGNAINIFNESMQSIQTWNGHIVRYLNDAYRMLRQNPKTEIAVIVSANTLFYFIMNAAINELKKPSSDKASERSYKQLFIEESFVAGGFYGFNYLLSKATNAQLDHTTIAMITSIAITMRMIVNHVLFKQKEEREEEIMKSSPISEQMEAIDLEEDLQDSPKKTPVNFQPTQLEIMKMQGNSQAERLEADLLKLKSERDGFESRMADLKAYIVELEENAKKLEKERTEAKDIQQEFARLKVENKGLEKNKSSLNKKIEQLESDLKEALLAENEPVNSNKKAVLDLLSLKKAKEEADEMRLKAEEELAAANEQLSSAEEEIQEFQQKNIQMEEEKKVMAQKFQILKGLLEELQRDADRLEQESDDDILPATEKVSIPKPKIVSLSVKPIKSPSKSGGSPLKKQIDHTLAEAAKIFE